MSICTRTRGPRLKYTQISPFFPEFCDAGHLKRTYSDVSSRTADADCVSMTWGAFAARKCLGFDVLSYCDRGECRDHACVGMTEPTSRHPQGAISLARVPEFRGESFMKAKAEYHGLNLSCESLMFYPLYVLSYCDGGECRDHACVGMTEPTSRRS